MSYTCSGCNRSYKRAPKRIYPFGGSSSLSMRVSCYLVCRKCYRKFPFTSYMSYRKSVIQRNHKDGRINRLTNGHIFRDDTRIHKPLLSTIITPYYSNEPMAMVVNDHTCFDET